MPSSVNRRKFIAQSSMASLAVGYSLSGIRALAGANKNRVRVGIIGTGMRGQSHIEMLLQRTDVDITALADPDPRMMADALSLIQKAGKPTPVIFPKGNYDYKNLLKRDDVDAVIIATPWEWHIPQALDSLNAGKIPGVEVCGALKLQDCWDIVNASEKNHGRCWLYLRRDGQEHGHRNRGAQAGEDANGSTQSTAHKGPE